MVLSWPAESELRGLYALNSKKETAEQKAADLLRLLALVFSQNKWLGTNGLQFFDAESDRSLFKVKCAVAEGRVRMQWRSNATTLEASMVVERKSFDQFDQVVWQPVLEIDLPENKLPTIVTKSGIQDLPFIDPHHGDMDSLIVKIGHSIVYALINGPSE